MLHRKSVVVILTAALLVALAGCTPSAAPAPDASDEPAASSAPETPTPSEAPGASTIVLDADALAIQDAAGAVLYSYPYEGGAVDAIAELTSLLGDPTSTYTPPGGCWTDMTTVKWNTLQLMYYGQDAATTRVFLLDSVNTPSTTVDITTPHGARVGDPWPAYFANVSDHLTMSAEYQGQQFMSVVDSTGADGPRSGTIVSSVDDVISSVAAPSSLDRDC